MILINFNKALFSDPEKPRHLNIQKVNSDMKCEAHSHFKGNQNLFLTSNKVCLLTNHKHRRTQAVNSRGKVLHFLHSPSLSAASFQL